MRRAPSPRCVPSMCLRRAIFGPDWASRTLVMEMFSSLNHSGLATQKLSHSVLSSPEHDPWPQKEFFVANSVEALDAEIAGQATHRAQRGSQHVELLGVVSRVWGLLLFRGFRERELWVLNPWLSGQGSRRATAGGPAVFCEVT